jgi:opacity protein-like surface antigen
MRRFSIAVWLLVFLVLCGVALAQAPGPSLVIPSTEVYGGFLVTSPDYGANWDSYLLHGFEGDFSKALSDRLWITGAGAFVFANPSLINRAGVPIPMHIKQLSATVGPKFFFLTGRFRPYATGQIGYARQSSNGFYGGDHHPPIPAGVHTVESGLTYRVGGGAEWQFTEHIYWRIVQWDIQPQPWGRHTPLYQNVGSGIGYRF